MTDVVQGAADVGATASRKITTRLVLLLFVLFVLSSIDRVNLGFAALQMNEDLGLSPSEYGLGASIFFVSYLLFQIPSVLLLRRIGLRRWVCLITVAWGTVAAAMALLNGHTMLYALRFALGAAEAGYAPGVIYTLGQWLPKRYRGGAIALTMIAIPVSVLIGAPLSGALLTLDSVGGIDGWRWMFFLEGLPTIAMGLLCLRLLVDRPEDASWLTVGEKDWVRRELAAEEAAAESSGGAASMMQALLSARVWASGLVWLSLLAGAYGLIFWLPQAIKQASGLDDFTTSLLSALPWIGVGIGMVANARHSDRTGERYLHVGLPAFAAGALLIAAAASPSGPLTLVLLTLAGVGLGGAQAVFWTVPRSLFAGAAAAGGIAFINLIGNTSSVVSPWAIGVIREETGSFITPVYAIAAILVAGGALIILLRPRGGAR